MIILKDTLCPNSFNRACFWEMLFSKRTECILPHPIVSLQESYVSYLCTEY